MKVVVDSSVLVSAFRSPSGTPATLLALGRQGAFSLYLSPCILAETANGLLNPKKNRHVRINPDEVAEYCAVLAAVATVIENLPNVGAVPRDPKDNHVVACALAAGADYLVTGDDHMLSLGEAYQGVRIVTPRRLLDLLTGKP